MGWDAYAKLNRGKNLEISNKEIAKAFFEAFVSAKSCDGFLKLGALDCSACRDMIQKACNISCYEDGYIVARNLKQNWNFLYEEEDYWAYYSAKRFIEICFEFDLSIYFSY